MNISKIDANKKSEHRSYWLLLFIREYVSKRNIHAYTHIVYFTYWLKYIIYIMSDMYIYKWRPLSNLALYNSSYAYQNRQIMASILWWLFHEYIIFMHKICLCHQWMTKFIALLWNVKPINALNFVVTENKLEVYFIF